MARTVVLAQGRQHRAIRTRWSTGDEEFLQQTAMPSQYDHIGWA
ncbi:hypothetical protein [Cellvibrio sp. UBA7671]